MTDAQPATRAPHTLIYVPGLSRDRSNTGEAVAASICAAADLRAGRFSVGTASPAPEGLRATGAIVNGEGKRLLDVYELDFRRTFEVLDQDRKGEEVVVGVVSALYFAARASFVWTKAF